MKREVIIVGGGVAGIQTALRLADRGIRPTIVEKERRSGRQAPGMVSSVPVVHAGVTRCLPSCAAGSPARDVEVMTSAEVAGRSARDSVTLGRRAHRWSAGSVVVCSGFTLFDARLKEEYGYGIYDNVFTTADIERMLNEGRVATSRRLAVRVASPSCTAWVRATRRSARQHCSKCVLHHGRQTGHGAQAAVSRGRRLQFLYGYPHVRARLRGDVPRGSAELQHSFRARTHFGGEPDATTAGCRSRPKIP